MSAPQGITVPHGLDDPPRFLLWSADVVFVALTVLFMFALVGATVGGVISGILSGFAWQRLVSARGRHYGIALCMWHLNLSPFKRIWPSFYRRFIG